MNSTQSKITGSGIAGMVCWTWNSIVCVVFSLPTVMQMPAEIGVAIGVICVAFADKWLNTALPVGEVTTVAAPATPAVPAPPDGTPLPDGGGREAPEPFQ